MPGLDFLNVACIYPTDLKLKNGRSVVQTTKKFLRIEKKIIQKDFHEQLGLIVDQPKPRYGRTNDGDTARRFFEDSSISSSITGVD